MNLNQEEHKSRWVFIDAERLSNPDKWPRNPLPLKTQPWVDGVRQFGYVWANSIGPGPTYTFNIYVRDFNDRVVSVEHYEDVPMTKVTERWAVD